MTEEYINKKGIYCPVPWWFRTLLVIQIVIFAITPNMNLYLLLGILVTLILEVRSPSIQLTHKGIILSYFGLYNHLLEWDKISEVRILRRTIYVDDGFVIPIFIQFWRKNFAEVKEILNERFNQHE